MVLASKIEYLTISGDTTPRYKKQLLDFYNHYFPEDSNHLIIENSSMFIIALEDNEIIGACRLLTDFSRNAVIFDLIVRKSYRNQGVGKKLTKNAIKLCRKHHIKKIYLMTDPRIAWLVKFYKKLGFSRELKQVLMKLIN